MKAKGMLKTSAVTLKKPIFIWGAGKCGSHLLYDILSLHPGLVCPTGPHRLNKGLWGAMHWGDSTPARLKERAIPQEGGRRFWIEAGVPFETIGFLTRQHLTEGLIREVRARYAGLVRGGRRVVDKTIAYILAVEAIDAVFPDAYHVFCIRDPRSVLNSILRISRFPEAADRTHQWRLRMDELGFWPVVPPGYEPHRNEPLVRRLSWQIRALYEIGFAQRAGLGERLVEFRYEDLLRDAHHQALKLFQRLALSPWDEVTQWIPPRFPNYAPPWPQRGNPLAEPYGKRRCYLDQEIEQLGELEDLAVQLGYEAFTPGELSYAAHDVVVAPVPSQSI